MSRKRKRERLVLQLTVPKTGKLKTQNKDRKKRYSWNQTLVTQRVDEYTLQAV